MTGKLKYRWDRTWPDSPNDYIALDETDCIGRVYLHNTRPVAVLDLVHELYGWLDVSTGQRRCS